MYQEAKKKPRGKSAFPLGLIALRRKIIKGVKNEG